MAFEANTPPVLRLIFQKKRIRDIRGEWNKTPIVRELWPAFRCTRDFYNALYADSINAGKCTPNQARDRSSRYHGILKSRLNNSGIITSYRTHVRLSLFCCVSRATQRVSRQQNMIIAGFLFVLKLHVKFLLLNVISRPNIFVH